VKNMNGVNKYVRFADGFFLLFSNISERDDVKYPRHDDVAAVHPTSQVISAGFIMFDGGDIVCTGGSSTLGIDNLGKEDEEVFKTKLFL